MSRALRGAVVVAGFGVLVATATLYGSHTPSEVDVTGSVRVSVSADPPIHLLAGDGQTSLASSDALDFGTVELDYWGTGPTPTVKLTVRNTSDTPELVSVTGDTSLGVVPVFGLHPEDLLRWPDNGFRLAASGDSGDRVEGWIGLHLGPEPGQDRVRSGVKETTVTLSATAPALPALPVELGFEDPTLGRVCLLSKALPLRDRFVLSHGVAFSGDAPTSGMAVLHRCANLDTPPSTGDYFLVSNSSAVMASGGVPWLPAVITFSYPVSEVEVRACSCGSSIGYTLRLRGYTGPHASGEEIGEDSHVTEGRWMEWRLVAPPNRSIQSVQLDESGGGRLLVVDLLEWRWSGE